MVYWGIPQGGVNSWTLIVINFRHKMRIKRPVKNPKETRRKGKTSKSLNTVEALIERGTEAITVMDFELAEQCYSSALSISSGNTSLMDALADVNIQLGDIDEA